MTVDRFSFAETILTITGRVNEIGGHIQSEFLPRP
jgi:hypothetical protein